MTPEQLLTFAVLSETLNISRTAQKLNLSQPAVSGQLKLLQLWFGEPLYQRQGHGVALTAAGKELAAHAQTMQEVYQQAKLLKRNYQNELNGTLFLGATITPASYLLPKLVAEFCQKHRYVKQDWAAGNTQEIVNRISEFDLAFIEGEVPQSVGSNTRIIDWQSDEIVAIVTPNHPLAKQKYTSLKTLANEALIMRERGSGVRRFIEHHFKQAGLYPEVALELAGIEGIKQAVRAELGVGFVSKLSMQVPDASLVAIRLTPRGLYRTLTILVPNAHQLSRVTEQFLNHILAKN